MLGNYVGKLAFLVAFFVIQKKIAPESPICFEKTNY